MDDDTLQQAAMSEPNGIPDVDRSKVSGNVGIVIVSHSAEVARGAADMVRGMVGDGVPLCHAGGHPAGGLGTDVAVIRAAIESVWSEAGVAIMVDLGAAEMNTRDAIELLSDQQRRVVRICNAPVVEGAVLAATEAMGGSSLSDVCMTAESALL